MGVGQLSIGIGKGGAQVFGNNPAIDQFADMLAQRKAKQDKDNQFLNEQLAQNYDPSSLRNDTDKQSYLKQYQTIRDQAIAAENEQNPHKKALAISEVRQQLGNLGAYAEGSKKQGLMEKQLAMEFMKNPDHYEDDSIDKYKSGLQKEWKDPDIISNASQVERRVDPNKLAEDYNKFKTEQIKPTQWSNGTHKVYNFDGKKKEVIEQNRGVPIDGDNGAYELMLHKASADPKWSKGLKDLYPDVQTGDKTQDLALRVRKYMHDQGDTQGWYDKPKEISMEGQTPDRFYSHYNYELAHPKVSGVQQQANTPTYFQDLSERMRTGVPGSGEEFAQQIYQNPLYGGKKPNFDLTNPKKVTITIPPKLEYKPNDKDANDKGYIVKTPEYKTILDSTDPESWTAGMAKIYKDVTGDQTAVPSKSMTPYGKGHVPGGKSATPTNSDDYKHTSDVKDSKGNIITIGYKNGKWYNIKTNKLIE